jgi:hypothetical protein
VCPGCLPRRIWILLPFWACDKNIRLLWAPAIISVFCVQITLREFWLKGGLRVAQVIQMFEKAESDYRALSEKKRIIENDKAKIHKVSATSPCHNCGC